MLRRRRPDGTHWPSSRRPHSKTGEGHEEPCDNHLRDVGRSPFPSSSSSCRNSSPPSSRPSRPSACRRRAARITACRSRPATPCTASANCRCGFDAFVHQFNDERPHQALDMKAPADVSVRSARVYHGLEELSYPFHDRTFTVTTCGRICFKGQKVNLSQRLRGTERRRDPGRRAHLARHLHARRCGLFRR